MSESSTHNSKSMPPSHYDRSNSYEYADMWQYDDRRTNGSASAQHAPLSPSVSSSRGAQSISVHPFDMKTNSSIYYPTTYYNVHQNAAQRKCDTDGYHPAPEYHTRLDHQAPRNEHILCTHDWTESSYEGNESNITSEQPSTGGDRGPFSASCATGSDSFHVKSAPASIQHPLSYPGLDTHRGAATCDGVRYIRPREMMGKKSSAQPSIHSESTQDSRCSRGKSKEVNPLTSLMDQFSASDADMLSELCSTLLSALKVHTNEKSENSANVFGDDHHMAIDTNHYDCAPVRVSEKGGQIAWRDPRPHIALEQHHRSPAESPQYDDVALRMGNVVHSPTASEHRLRSGYEIGRYGAHHDRLPSVHLSSGLCIENSDADVTHRYSNHTGRDISSRQTYYPQNSSEAPPPDYCSDHDNYWETANSDMRFRARNQQNKVLVDPYEAKNYQQGSFRDSEGGIWVRVHDSRDSSVCVSQTQMESDPRSRVANFKRGTDTMPISREAPYGHVEYYDDPPLTTHRLGKGSSSHIYSRPPRVPPGFNTDSRPPYKDSEYRREHTSWSSVKTREEYGRHLLSSTDSRIESVSMPSQAGMKEAPHHQSLPSGMGKSGEQVTVSKKKNKTLPENLQWSEGLRAVMIRNIPNRMNGAAILNFLFSNSVLCEDPAFKKELAIPVDVIRARTRHRGAVHQDVDKEEISLLEGESSNSKNLLRNLAKDETIENGSEVSVETIRKSGDKNDLKISDNERTTQIDGKRKELQIDGKRKELVSMTRADRVHSSADCCTLNKVLQQQFPGRYLVKEEYSDERLYDPASFWEVLIAKIADDLNKRPTAHVLERDETMLVGEWEKAKRPMEIASHYLAPHAGRFLDFFHLPATANEINFGYCFANFRTPELAYRFKELLEGKRLPSNSKKRLEITPARLGGAGVISVAKMLRKYKRNAVFIFEPNGDTYTDRGHDQFDTLPDKR